MLWRGVLVKWYATRKDAPHRVDAEQKTRQTPPGYGLSQRPAAGRGRSQPPEAFVGFGWEPVRQRAVRHCRASKKTPRSQNKHTARPFWVAAVDRRSATGPVRRPHVVERSLPTRRLALCCCPLPLRVPCAVSALRVCQLLCRQAIAAGMPVGLSEVGFAFPSPLKFITSLPQ